MIFEPIHEYEISLPKKSIRENHSAHQKQRAGRNPSGTRIAGALFGQVPKKEGQPKPPRINLYLPVLNLYFPQTVKRKCGLRIQNSCS